MKKFFTYSFLILVLSLVSDCLLAQQGEFSATLDNSSCTGKPECDWIKLRCLTPTTNLGHFIELVDPVGDYDPTTSNTIDLSLGAPPSPYRIATFAPFGTTTTQDSIVLYACSDGGHAFSVLDGMVVPTGVLSADPFTRGGLKKYLYYSSDLTLDPSELQDYSDVFVDGGYAVRTSSGHTAADWDMTGDGVFIPYPDTIDIVNSNIPNNFPLVDVLAGDYIIAREVSVPTDIDAEPNDTEGFSVEVSALSYNSQVDCSCVSSNADIVISSSVSLTGPGTQIASFTASSPVIALGVITCTLTSVDCEWDSKASVFNASFSVVTPVEILYLDGYADGSTNVIKFATASEVNNDKFLIDRSDDGGQTFYTIGQVLGAGDSVDEIEYSFVDNRGGNAYYQIRQYDFDGKNETFGPIIINNDKEGALSPDIIINSGLVEISGLAEGTPYDIYVYSSQGKKLLVNSGYASGERIDVIELSLLKNSHLIISLVTSNSRISRQYVVR